MRFDLLNDRGSVSFGESMALKAVSLLLALTLWITILGFKREEIQVYVPIEPILAPRMVLSGKLTPVEFVLSGPRVLLSDVGKKLHPIRPDLTRANDPVVGVSIRQSMIGELPHEIRVVRYSPQTVLVKLDELVEGHVAVKPDLRGTVADGYALSSVKATPERLLVLGPSNFFKGAEPLLTEPVDIEALAKTTVFTVAVKSTEAEPYRLVGQRTVKVEVVVHKARRKEQ